MNVCSSCNKEFLNKYNLKRHQDTNICTVIHERKQRQIHEKTTTKKIFECIHCKKILSTKQRLTYHTEKCKQKPKSKTVEMKCKELEEKITEMTKEIETLKVKPIETIIKIEQKDKNNNTNIEQSCEKSTVDEKTGKQRKKKETIPKSVRSHVWNLYIGPNINEHRCLCCKKAIIKITDFDCGHVIAESKGGTHEIGNLRPICSPCNHSIGTQNMIDFVMKYGYYIG